MRCVGWLPCTDQSGNALRIAEQEKPGSKRCREGVMVIETLSTVDVTYKYSERMTLNDAQEAERLVSMDDQVSDDDEHIADSHKNWYEPVEEMAWNFHGLKGGDNRDVSALQVIHELYKVFSVNELKTLATAKSIIEDDLFSMSRVVELADQLDEVRKTSEIHEGKYETDVSRMKDIAAQHTLIK